MNKCYQVNLRVIFCSVIFSIAIFLNSQPYEANWESLDKRPVADWFADAKFGIFIHWGPYSVPAWSPKGTYSEWYQYWMQSKALFGNGDFKGDEVWEFHKKTYGDHFDYYEFAEQFTADLYEPDQWAKLFKKSGAKYIVLTSKHHDGFTLWPNEQANDRGFAWNSVDTGPKRDLAGDLSDAVKEVGLKMGFYYSLYEWYHPWWRTDKERFINEHFHPQFKDLIEKYQPDILWGDGEWDLEYQRWRTPELLAWLFNESSVKDKVVINDRWGKGTRQKHGGYYTTEYEAGKTFDKPWEECRGMGFSFGYNQNEDASDYNSTRALLLLLVDIVSNGGNLLLDIGPDGRGKIPPIMQQRLLEMGEWLKVNGDAIYGTRKWKRAVQWSEGDQELDKSTHYLGGDYILKQTIDPPKGKAIKELFFTSKGSDLYAISPIFPKGELVVRDLTPSEQTKVNLLGVEADLTYQHIDGNLVIEIPHLSYDDLPSKHAWTFKISNIN
ncbi:MAG: alpha-L-fucosidase [Flavobacteriaceae bacterium]|nr:alpha-L-fucosidase [Flavobacteriaceae bacterium]